MKRCTYTVGNKDFCAASVVWHLQRTAKKDFGVFWLNRRHISEK